MDFFSTRSVFQDAVDKATSEFLVGADWSLNLHICDVVNSAPDEAPKEVLKAVKKRLKEKNPKIQMLTLTLLETLVKNCQYSFHQALANKEFLEVMVKLTQKEVRKMSTEEIQVREKVLELIQTWAEAFQRFAHRMPAFNEVYEGLRKKGVEFPARSSEETAPIFTPPASAAPSPPTPSYPAMPPQQAAPMQHAPRQTHRPAHPQAPAASRAPDLAKLKSDLATVQENVALLMELVGASTPDEDLTKNELVQELLTIVKEMHRRVMVLIEELPDESILATLLDVNDRITRVFELYAERTQPRQHAPVVPPSSVPVYQDPLMMAPPAAATTTSTVPPPAIAQPSFSLDELLGAPIDAPPLGAPVPIMGAPIHHTAADLPTGMASLTLSAPTAPAASSRQIAFDEDEDDGFDAIAHRSAPAAPPAVVSPPPIMMVEPLISIPAPVPEYVPQAQPVVRQSDDFDDFLSSRIPAGATPAAAPAATTQQKLEKTDNDVFGL